MQNAINVIFAISLMANVAMISSSISTITEAIVMLRNRVSALEARCK